MKHTACHLVSSFYASSPPKLHTHRNIRGPLASDIYAVSDFVIFFHIVKKEAEVKICNSPNTTCDSCFDHIF